MTHAKEIHAPIDPGEILNEEFLSPMNLSQYHLAKSIGVDPKRIHAIVHGERSITAETALLLSRFFSETPGSSGWASRLSTTWIWRKIASARGSLP